MERQYTHPEGNGYIPRLGLSPNGRRRSASTPRPSRHGNNEWSDSSVSEMTDPTFFRKDGPPKTIISSSPRRNGIPQQHEQQTFGHAGVSPSAPRLGATAAVAPVPLKMHDGIPVVQGIDPFDVEHPVFHSAFGNVQQQSMANRNVERGYAGQSTPLTATIAGIAAVPAAEIQQVFPPSPHGKLTSPIASDDFSDPFFPPSNNATNETTSDDIPDPKVNRENKRTGTVDAAHREENVAGQKEEEKKEEKDSDADDGSHAFQVVATGACGLPHQERQKVSTTVGVTTDLPTKSDPPTGKSPKKTVTGNHLVVGSVAVGKDPASRYQRSTMIVAKAISAGKMTTPTAISPGMSEKLKKRQERRNLQKTGTQAPEKKQETECEKAAALAPSVGLVQRRLPTAYKGRLKLIRGQSPTPNQEEKQTKDTNPSAHKPPVPESRAKIVDQRAHNKQLLENSSKAKTAPAPEEPRQSRNRPQVSRLSKEKASLGQIVSTSSTKPSDYPTSDDESRSLASARADINRLRTYVRRGKKNQIPPVSQNDSMPIASAFMSYDEDAIQDPMQRAGLRLLSAAVIPIQCASRRHLALKQALTRMWAVVVMQSLARRWLAQSRYYEQLVSVIVIQSWYRGCRTRDDQLLQQCCAIEIQRYIRGYLATIRVYEDIFRVTVAQSIVRRKQAMDLATNKMIFIIQLQSLARGYLARESLKAQNNAATKLQTSWRGFFCQFNYQLDLLDIIIVQSIWRRNAAMKYYTRSQVIRRYAAATLIQAQWRTYSCRQSYIEYQSATLIQAHWRSFATSRWYLSYIAAMMIQAQIRRYFRQQSYKEFLAARKIQAIFRGYVLSKKYTQYRTNLSRYVAASVIQAQWRCYSCTRNYMKIVAAIMIQASWRSYVCSKAYLEIIAATMIQAVWRAKVCRHDYIRLKSAVRIQSHWRAYACTLKFLHNVADVVTVQCAIRRWQAVRYVKEYKNKHAVIIQSCLRRSKAKNELYALREKANAAVTIQRVWRGFITYANFMFTVADIVICQSIARRKIAIKRASEKRMTVSNKAARVIQRCARHRSKKRLEAAIRIQCFWRGFVGQVEYLIAKYENSAATTIQSAWRKFWVYSNFVITLDSAITIQTAFRSYKWQKNYAVNQFAATCLQRAFRLYLLKKNLQQESLVLAILSAGLPEEASERQSAVVIQTAIRKHLARTEFSVNYSARTIQSTFRGFYIRNQYVSFHAARKIQAFWRGARLCRLYREFRAAVKLQALWRGARLHRLYREFRAAVKLQSFWRQKMARAKFEQMREDLMPEEIVAAIIVQSVWRGVHVRKKGPKFIFWQWKMLLGDPAAITIQKTWRGYNIVQEYWNSLGSIIQIQAAVRGWRIRRYKRILVAVVKFQALFRGYSTRTHLRAEAATIKVQTAARRYIAQRSYRREIGVIRLQAAARRFLARTEAAEKLGSTILLQSVMRGCFARVEARRRRLIFMFVKTADTYDSSGKTAHEEAHQCRLKQLDTAARTIQRFFLMVKEEVDREIKAAKKRRKARKKYKKRVSSVDADDDVLEVVWQATVDSQDIMAPGIIRRARNAAAHELSVPSFSSNCSPSFNTRSKTPRNGEDEIFCLNSMHSTLSTAGRPNFPSPRRTSSYRPPPSPPANHPFGNPELRTTGSYRPPRFPQTPPSRFATLSRDELEEDFYLEEAWIDTEIHHAKERRRLESNKKRRQQQRVGTSSNNRPSSRDRGSSSPSRRLPTPTSQQQQQQHYQQSLKDSQQQQQDDNSRTMQV